MRIHYRLSVPLVVLLTVAGIAGFVAAAQQKAVKSKSKLAGPMPILPPLPTTGTLQPPGGNTDFTFIVAGDNRPATQTATPSAITSQLIADMQKYQPSFILWTGDAIAGKEPNNPTLIQQEYQSFLGLLQPAGVPVFFAPGNHEMNAANNAPCPAMQTLYQQNMITELYGAFAYGNSRFIALDTDSLKQSAKNCPAQPKGFDNKGYVNRDQLANLDTYLSANTDARHIFIFMHRPMFPKSGGVGLDAVSTKKLKNIFKKYKNISYVLAAHEHLYYNHLTGDNSPPPCLPSKKKKPFYLVSGGAGAPLSGDKDEEEEEKGEFDPDAFYNYLVFQVKAHHVNVTLVNCGTDPTKAQCVVQPVCGGTE
jgi:calcineurin-like phosphoesterase family protein